MDLVFRLSRPMTAQKLKEPLELEPCGHPSALMHPASHLANGSTGDHQPLGLASDKPSEFESLNMFMNITPPTFRYAVLHTPWP